MTTEINCGDCPVQHWDTTGCANCDKAVFGQPPQTQLSGSLAGSISDSPSVVADYIAFCKHCGGWVGVADACTPETVKAHQGDVMRWIAEGHRVELVKHAVDDPMPEQCKNWPAWWDCESVKESSDFKK